MIPRLALLPIGLFIIWCFVCSRWYVCHIRHLCGPVVPDVVDTTVVVPPKPDERPLVFKWADPTPIARSTFDAFKKGQSDGLGVGQKLEVIGSYFKDEPAPAGFSNMGLARAAKTAALFIPPLAAGSIIESSKLIEAEPPGIRGDTLFESIVFQYYTIATVPDVECIKNSDNTLTLLFPYGKAQREVDLEIEKCLQNVIERLKQTNERITIVGHTDDAGTDAFNMGLGQRRADHIKEILVKNGIDKNRISTESRGEREPVANNATEEGSRMNRRAVMTIIKE